MSFCPQCGRPRGANARFCGGCGTEFDRPTADAEAAGAADPDEPASEPTDQIGGERTRLDTPVEPTRLDMPAAQTRLDAAGEETRAAPTPWTCRRNRPAWTRRTSRPTVSRPAWTRSPGRVPP